jgi:thiamine-monophosphate kinase
MSLGEFAVLEEYFRQPRLTAAGGWPVDLGPGDDCALLNVPSGQQLVVSMDTLVAGRHFPLGAPPKLVGFRALGVTLSDLAAMGAEPAWFTLGLTLPEIDKGWLQDFADGLAAMAAEHRVSLVGGDLTQGPLALTLQVHGFCKPGRVMCRHSARAGERIYVTGTLGDAAAGLEYALEGGLPPTRPKTAEAFLLQRYYKPQPRLRMGQQLVEAGVACGIDISDGLLADLGHILKQSGLGAVINPAAVPLSAELLENSDPAKALRLAFTGGDDYEICFTLAPAQASGLSRCLGAGAAVACIGEVVPGSGIINSTTRQPFHYEKTGFEHFG